MVELLPNPLSDRSYHDATLTGLFSENGIVLLILRDRSGERIEIELSGVRWFLACDVMVGNIVDRVDLHEITAENVSTILQSFSDTKSEYFTAKSIEAIRSAGNSIGLKFVSLHPVYGASCLAICETVQERRE